MSFIDVLEIARMGKRDVAATLLREEFVKLQFPEQRVNLCKWIATCFEGLEDYANAAEWFEITGVLSLSETSSDAVNAIRALPEFEKARTYYTMCGDEERLERCSFVISQLNRCFIAA